MAYPIGTIVFIQRSQTRRSCRVTHPAIVRAHAPEGLHLIYLHLFCIDIYLWEHITNVLPYNPQMRRHITLCPDNKMSLTHLIFLHQMNGFDVADAAMMWQQRMGLDEWVRRLPLENVDAFVFAQGLSFWAEADVTVFDI